MVDRREVASRNAGFAKSTASFLAKLGFTPNMISVASMLFALLSLVSYEAARSQQLWLLLAVFGIQGRLLCNLFDGMLAIEHGVRSKYGELYNEVPDRVSDALILMGVGLYLRPMEFVMDLAWLAVVLSTMTAYLRTFGASLVKKHYFTGPMAKQHRMFLVTLGTIATFFWAPALFYVLVIMNVGLVVTNLRRLRQVAIEMESQGKG